MNLKSKHWKTCHFYRIKRFLTWIYSIAVFKHKYKAIPRPGVIQPLKSKGMSFNEFYEVSPICRNLTSPILTSPSTRTTKKTIKKINNQKKKINNQKKKNTKKTNKKRSKKRSKRKRNPKRRNCRKGKNCRRKNKI